MGSFSKKRSRSSLYTCSSSHIQNSDTTKEIWKIATQHWKFPSRDAEAVKIGWEAVLLVSDIYRTKICSHESQDVLSALVTSDYFSAFLWPAFCQFQASKELESSQGLVHNFIYSIANLALHMHLVDSKATDTMLQHFSDDIEAFRKVCLYLFQTPDSPVSHLERCTRPRFFAQMFSYSFAFSTQTVLHPLVSLPVWTNLSAPARNEQTEKYPDLRKPILKLVRRAKKRKNLSETPLLEHGLFDFVRELEGAILSLSLTVSEPELAVAGGLVSLLINLVAQRRTRGIVLPLLSDRSTVPLLQGFTAQKQDDDIGVSGKCWNDWVAKVNLLANLFHFPHDPEDDKGLSLEESRIDQSRILLKFQSAALAITKRRKLHQGHALASLSLVSQRAVSSEHLRSALLVCENDILEDLRQSLGVHVFSSSEFLGFATKRDAGSADRLELVKVMAGALTCMCIPRPLAFETFQNASLVMPVEGIAMRDGSVSCLSKVSFPCVTPEFLNAHDYLLRNAMLCKALLCLAVCEDIEQILSEMLPSWDGGRVRFAGQSRAGLPVLDISVQESGRVEPTAFPSKMITLEFDGDCTSCTRQTREEWDSIRSGDMLFLLKLAAPLQTEGSISSRPQKISAGSTLTVVQVQSSPLHDAAPGSTPSRQAKIVTGLADADGFKFVRDNEGSGGREFSQILQLVFRRPKQDNMFLSLFMELQKMLLIEDKSVPVWLENILLGHHVVKEGQWKDHKEEDSLNFFDTFLSAEHLRVSFPTMQISETSEDAYRRMMYNVRVLSDGGKMRLEAEPYRRTEDIWNGYQRCIRGDLEKAKMNETKFTVQQVEAIRSGMRQGLTLLAGAPGTGKTACVVQIIANLFRGDAGERVLIIAHSDRSLQSIVSKVRSLGVDPLRVVELTNEDFTDVSLGLESLDAKVNAMLVRRSKLLSEVASLASHLSPPDVHSGDWTCESADRFYHAWVRPQWDDFTGSKDLTWHTFPFREYFRDFFNRNKSATDGSYSENLLTGRDPLEAYSMIASLFAELEDLRFLEVFRESKHRRTFVLSCYSRVVVMKSTHAASHRRSLIEERFSYETLVVEEANEALEVETLLGMVGQKGPARRPESRLKRVVLVADPGRLPRVHKMPNVRKVCTPQITLFRRLSQLGNNVIELTQQGRYRVSIADLFRWQYPKLRDMSHVSLQDSFVGANPGFLHVAQFIDTGDLHSESSVSHCFQNRVEAEYIAFLFLYMCLLGYPPCKIAILVTCKAQVHLVRSTIESRLSQFSLESDVCIISTVEDFRDRTTDYVLFSFVRTSKFVYQDDLELMGVAMSRARLGLYIFGYLPTFETCACSAAFFKALPPSTKLTLVGNESIADCNRTAESAPGKSVPERVVHSAADMAQIVSHIHRVTKGA